MSTGNHPRHYRIPALATSLALVLAAIPSSAVRADEAVRITRSDVAWLWDAADVTGSSMLVRSDSGISAMLDTSGLTPGQAVTLWFVVFNNPSACATDPCSAPDLFGIAAEGDFLFAGGHVIGGRGKGNYGAHLAVGDNSGSGMFEIGAPDLAVGLTNPRGAEVHLLVHSHGPAVPGQTLKAQISSFLGGCQTLLGNAFGQAEGPGDVPDAVGECSTIQGSLHR